MQVQEQVQEQEGAGSRTEFDTYTVCILLSGGRVEQQARLGGQLLVMITLRMPSMF